jgi:hypothetical protein
VASLRLESISYRKEAGLRLSVRLAWLASRVERCAALAAAVLIILGFFLPWTRGVGPFSMRSFSGFELARLARDASGGDSLLSLQTTAIALYLVPAIAINALLLSATNGLLRLSPRQRSVASLGAGAYGCLVTAVALFLMLVPTAGVDEVLHRPEIGLGFEAAGSLGFIYLGAKRLAKNA